MADFAWGPDGFGIYLEDNFNLGGDVNLKLSADIPVG